jgi:hypothetical protein
MWETPDKKEIDKKAFFLIAQLAGLGVASVFIEFSGAGDDGSIEGVTLNDAENKAIDGHDELCQEIEDWAYKLLDHTEVDWVNNEGGFGEIAIDVAERKYEFTVNCNTSDSYVAASGERQFGMEGGGDGEEESTDDGAARANVQ